MSTKKKLRSRKENWVPKAGRLTLTDMLDDQRFLITDRAASAEQLRVHWQEDFRERQPKKKYWSQLTQDVKKLSDNLDWFMRERDFLDMMAAKCDTCPWT